MSPVCFFVCLSVLGTGFAGAQEFIDDQAMSSQFEAKLAALAESGRGISMGRVRSAISKASGKRLSTPPIDFKTPESPSDSYGSAAAAVVAIGSVYKCGECDKWHQDGFSSGWIFSPDGLVVTNAHVLEGEAGDWPGVMLRNGSVFAIEDVVAANQEADIAVLKIDPGGKKLPALPLAETAGIGEEVHVLSHPQGRLWCLTSGRISRFHRQTDKREGRTTEWMSVTADFAGGSSGGPVLNSRGEVAGMVASTTTAYSNAVACKEHPDPDVQMVFKDCVPLKALQDLIRPEGL
jgi:serine protease Do